MLLKPVTLFFQQVPTEPNTNRNRYDKLFLTAYSVSVQHMFIDCNAYMVYTIQNHKNIDPLLQLALATSPIRYLVKTGCTWFHATIPLDVIMTVNSLCNTKHRIQCFSKQILKL